MERLEKPRPRSAKILEFDGPMSSSSRRKSSDPNQDSKPDPTPATTPKLAGPGRIERWTPIVATIVGAFFASTAYYHSVHHDDVAALAQGADDHVKDLIEGKLDPLRKDIQGLAAQMNQVIGQLNQMNLNRNVADLKHSALELQSRGNSQGNVLADIRASLKQAQQIQQKLPLTGLVKQIQLVPPTARDYWATVAAIINYQSYLNQLNHNAPDPEKVAEPCMFVTGGEQPNIHTNNNVLFQSRHFKDCIVDLDTSTNTVVDAVVEDSVVRYHGGQVTFINVLFVNCRFELDIKGSEVPQRPDLLLALLKDQTYLRFKGTGEKDPSRPVPQPGI